MKAGFSVKTVWYLHGFASSSESDKARLVKDYFARELSAHNLVVPDLPYTPQEAWQELQQLAAVQPPDFIIGSSLGGFLATALAEQFACPAALINPAVWPHLLLANHLGRYWHPVRQQHYEVTEQHLPQLAALAVEHIEQPAQLLVLLQTGDEVLDYRQALAFYANCQLDVEEGGDHSYQNLSRRLPDIANFGRLT